MALIEYGLPDEEWLEKDSMQIISLIETRHPPPSHQPSPDEDAIIDYDALYVVKPRSPRLAFCC